MIVAEPVAIPVTSPVDETVATDEFDVPHVTVAPDIVLPTASLTVAVRVTVSPTDVKVLVFGDSVTAEAVCDTVTAAVPFAEPDVAVIVAEPAAIPVTSPVDETVAMDEFDVPHETVAPDRVLPTVSLTVAVRVTVSPTDVKVLVFGDSVTVEAVCDTVTEVVAVNEPNVAVIVAEPSATEVTRPADKTVATDEFDVAHETVAPLIVLPTASLTVAASVAVSESDVNDRLVGESVIVAAV